MPLFYDYYPASLIQQQSILLDARLRYLPVAGYATGIRQTRPPVLMNQAALIRTEQASMMAGRAGLPLYAKHHQRSNGAGVGTLAVVAKVLWEASTALDKR